MKRPSAPLVPGFGLASCILWSCFSAPAADWPEFRGPTRDGHADVTGGRVLMDGVDVRELRLEDLWDAFGIVPQRAFLFSGTVGSNVRFGDAQASDEQVWTALETAQAREFVDQLPNGLAAPVVTQNVDGLHTSAGSSTVQELHGSLQRVRCLAAGHRAPFDRTVWGDDCCPQCPGCGAPCQIGSAHV